MSRRRALYLGMSRRWPAIGTLGLSIVLAGCAQSGGILTGALDPVAAPAGMESAGPPLPERRSRKDAPGRSTGASLLAALPDIDLSAPGVAPSSAVSQEKPVNIYVHVARQIRRCWLGSDSPKLPGHGFRASAQPGEAGDAEIDIYKEVEGRKYGPFAFEVKITPQGSGSLVQSRNRSLDDALANELRGDVARWTQGGSGCAAAAVGNT